jgi:hypothetical protein
MAGDSGMKRNRIVVFNRVTATDTLEDVSIFEDLVGIHYDKFCQLYSFIEANDFIDYIDDINCKLEENSVKFYIRFNKVITKKDCMLLMDQITDDMELTNTDNKNITISVQY